MRNSPLKGLLSKKDKSPLEIDSRFDQTFYDPKTQLELNKKGIHVGKTKNVNKAKQGTSKEVYNKASRMIVRKKS